MNNEKNATAKEKALFDIIVSGLKPQLAANKIPEHILTLHPTDNDCAIYIKSLVACRIKIRGKSCYIAFDSSNKDIVQKLWPGDVQETSGNMIRVSWTDSNRPDYQVFSDLVGEVIIKTFFSLKKEFDCCHLYKECSDAKECICPDWEYAIGCGYRRIMRKGQIFYGENRNILPPWSEIHPSPENL